MKTRFNGRIILAILAAIILASSVAPIFAASPVTVNVTTSLKFNGCKVVSKEVTSSAGSVTLDKGHKTGRLALDLAVDNRLTMRVFCDGSYLVTYWPTVKIQNGWLHLSP